MYRAEITITGAMLTLFSGLKRAVQWLNIYSLILSSVYFTGDRDD
jgi:hypothetical protein